MKNVFIKNGLCHQISKSSTNQKNKNRFDIPSSYPDQGFIPASTGQGHPYPEHDTTRMNLAAGKDPTLYGGRDVSIEMN